MPDPREVHISVFIDDPNVRPLKFHFTSADLPVGPNNELTFENHHHPGFNISFDLQEPRHGYMFPRMADAKQAIWSKFGAGACPKTKVWEVFSEPRITPTRETLRVHNRNSKSETGPFGYTLWVTKDDGNTYLDLDPGGTNRNGPSQ